MAQLNKTFNNHSINRYYDRAIETDINRKKIAIYLENGGKVHYAKRMSSTKSLAYIPIDDQIIKVIMNRKRNFLLTILPWQDDFFVSIVFDSEHYGNKRYMVELFPDCYLETNNKNALTKIYQIDESTEDRTEIPHNHPFFDGLFETAWIAWEIKKCTNSNCKPATVPS